MQLDHNSSDSDGPKSPGEGDQVDGNETKSASMPPHTGHMAGEHVLTPREATAQKKFQEEMQDVSKTPLSKGAGHTGDTTERKTGKKKRKQRAPSSADAPTTPADKHTRLTEGSNTPGTQKKKKKATKTFAGRLKPENHSLLEEFQYIIEGFQKMKSACKASKIRFPSQKVWWTMYKSHTSTPDGKVQSPEERWQYLYEQHKAIMKHQKRVARSAGVMKKPVKAPGSEGVQKSRMTKKQSPEVVPGSEGVQESRMMKKPSTRVHKEQGKVARKRCQEFFRQTAKNLPQILVECWLKSFCAKQYLLICVLMFLVSLKQAFRAL